MTILILFAFIAGVVTILSPCILPLLPIILSGSVGNGKLRPFGIVTGFILSFSFFTLFLSVLVKALAIPPDLLRTSAVFLLLLFGLSLLIPKLQLFIETVLSRMTSKLPQQNGEAGFFSGFLLGLTLGLVWSPCVGPILASVITLAATSSVSGAAVVITIAYAVGTALPMLGIIYTGRRLLQRVPGLVARTGLIQKIFGVIILLTALSLYFSLDRTLQTWIIQTFPKYGAGLTKIEELDVVESQLARFKNTENASPVVTSTLLSQSGTPAPDFTEGGEWLNSQPLSLKNELQGKVVLVDFWTYSCINCIRTLPYVTGWYEKYKDAGLVVVGVHSPEFEFEKVKANVEQAVTDFNITYPVVLDNEFAIWKAYKNQYWPAHYLIDKNGEVRYTHFGEGKYTETENAIRTLLDEPLLEEKATELQLLSPARKSITHETYLGWSRAEAYAPATRIKADATTEFTLADTLDTGEVSLGGSWQSSAEKITARSQEAVIQMKVTASDVFLVLEPPTNETGTVTVLIDGQPIDAGFQTEDMNADGQITVTSPGKYDIAHFGDTPEEHVITLQFSNGTAAFAFTFG